MVLFKIGLPRFIKKLSLRNDLNLLESAAKNQNDQSLSSITLQSIVTYCRLLNIFKAFFYKIRNPHVFSYSNLKVMEGFSVISNLADTTRIAINYSRADIFLK